MKYAKLRADWTVILELLRQHKERMAALLVAKKASKDLFSSVVDNANLEDLRLELERPELRLGLVLEQSSCLNIDFLLKMLLKFEFLARLSYLIFKSHHFNRLGTNYRQLILYNYVHFSKLQWTCVQQRVKLPSSTHCHHESCQLWLAYMRIEFY